MKTPSLLVLAVLTALVAAPVGAMGPDPDVSAPTGASGATGTSGVTGASGVTEASGATGDVSDGATTVEEVVVIGRKKQCDADWMTAAAAALQDGKPVEQKKWGSKPYLAKGADHKPFIKPGTSTVCTERFWSYAAYLNARKIEDIKPLYGKDLAKQLEVLQTVYKYFLVYDKQVTATLVGGEALASGAPANLGTQAAPSQGVTDFQASVVTLSGLLLSDPWHAPGQGLQYDQALALAVKDGTPIDSDTRKAIAADAAVLKQTPAQAAAAGGALRTAAGDLGRAPDLNAVAADAAGSLQTGLAANLAGVALPLQPVQHLVTDTKIPAPITASSWQAAQAQVKPTSFLDRVGRFFGGIVDFVTGKGDTSMDRLTQASDDAAFRTTAQKAENSSVHAVTVQYDGLRAGLDPSSPNYSEQVIALNNSERTDVDATRQSAYQGVLAEQTPAVQAQRAQNLAAETKIYDDGIAAAIKKLHATFAQPADNKPYVSQVDAYFAKTWPDGQRSPALQSCEQALGLSGEFRDLKDPTSDNVARYCRVRAGLDDGLRNGSAVASTH